MVSFLAVPIMCPQIYGEEPKDDKANNKYRCGYDKNDHI
jgi:hypothetical protein